ncbi:glycosyltransferase family 9 protein [Phenylobacterium deserti]|uniref:Uncharacterized protein n=1 Tax=Phenylobacterium deserti TaxID=1914756 RepID=A0A328ASB1_9CAUL|nr:glycosyltransferase family 9 protein [Phenylobacterium deserti]RAK57151.1 hypothetical protein DJ018_04125 [Phenylobacterium deserti]
MADYDALMAQADAARGSRRRGEAEALYRQAIQAAPERPEPLHYLAGLRVLAGDLAEAEALYRAALARDGSADASARGLASVLLEQGRYREGFAYWEARHQLARMAKPPLPFAEWRGEPIAGKRLLVWPEQGFGDQIQFARFLPMLQARGAELTVFCRPGLERLLSQWPGVDVRPADGPVEFPDPDYWVMFCSLAGRMGLEVGDIPGGAYLRAPQEGPSPPAGARIGVMTAGNPEHGNDAHRSLPAEQAARLHALPGTIDLSPASTGARDFADTAKIIAGLDLVISVDTSAAHLAGALGRPCWTLLPAVGTDWRWMHGRRDTPWYESMRLYRQPGEGRWAEVVDQVLEDAAGLNGRR